MSRSVPEDEAREAIGCALVIGWALGVGSALIYLGWVGIIS